MVEDSFEDLPEWDVIFTQNQHEIPIDPNLGEGFELHDDFLSKEELLEKRMHKQQPIQHQSSKIPSTISENIDSKVPVLKLIPTPSNASDSMIHPLQSQDERGAQSTASSNQRNLYSNQKGSTSPIKKNSICSDQREPISSSQRENLQENLKQESSKQYPSCHRQPPKRYGYDGTNAEFAGIGLMMNFQRMVLKGI